MSRPPIIGWKPKRGHYGVVRSKASHVSSADNEFIMAYVGQGGDYMDRVTGVHTFSEPSWAKVLFMDEASATIRSAPQWYTLSNLRWVRDFTEAEGAALAVWLMSGG